MADRPDERTRAVSGSYEQLLEQGHDLAWAGNWREAAAAYRNAVTLRGDDAVGYINLGLALAKSGDPREALRAYQRALVLNPGDVTTLQKVAELHAQLGERLQAASTYLLLADRYIEARQPANAVRAWQQVVQYEPTNRVAFRRLADAYQRGRRNDLAAQALTALARIHAEAGETNEAAQLAQQALGLSPESAPARQLLTVLRAAPPDETAPMPRRRGTGTLLRGTGAGPRGTDPLDFSTLQTEAPPDEDEEAREASPGRSPAEVAQERAVARLANSIFEGGRSNPRADALLARALDLQTRGLVEEAARFYEQVIQEGSDSADTRVTLATLYQKLFRFGDAVQQFEQVIGSPEYGVAALFGIGQCYWNQGRIDEALQHFQQAVESLDPEATEREQADELLGAYAGLVDAYDAMGDQEEAQRVVTRLSDSLSNRGWDERLREWQGYYGAGTGVPIEPLDSRVSALIESAMEAATQYRARGLVSAAIDEVYEALPEAPHYLPMHLLLAELFLEDRRVDAAVAKLITVADVYLIRSNPTQAVRVLKRALEIAPVEQSVRGRLIDLLMTHGEIDEAIHHTIQLAEGFYELAQIDRAVDKLNEALRLAPRANMEHEWQIRVQRRLADIHLQRLDWRRAAAAFEGVYNLRPEDLEVARRLSDLYGTKLGQAERAQALIEQTVQRLGESGDVADAVRFMQEEIEARPNDPDLFRLLGELYVAGGNVEAAAQSWEQAVELLVRGQERAQAAALLRRIVSLHSAREQRYRAMLNHMMKM